MKNFDEAFDANFSLVSLMVNRHLINHMRRVVTQLDMDLESAYLWGILAHLNVLGSIQPETKITALLDEDGAPLKGINPVSLATLSQVSGFPRETVRRKLLGLQESGKAQRLENGHWIVAIGGVDEGIEAFTKETVLQLLGVAKEVTEVLERSNKNKAK